MRLMSETLVAEQYSTCTISNLSCSAMMSLAVWVLASKFFALLASLNTMMPLYDPSSRDCSLSPSILPPLDFIFPLPLLLPPPDYLLHPAASNRE